MNILPSLHRSVFLLALSTIFGCSSKITDSEKPVLPGEAYRSFSEDGAWCWFSDPRAVYFDGEHRRTYSGWVDSAGNIVVGYYDYDSDSVKTTIVHALLEKDDHDNPSFLMDKQGRLMVFYSKHGRGNSPIFLARARDPEQISTWQPVQKLRLNDTIAYAGMRNTYTYSNIVRLADEDDHLYLFWRGADFKPNYSVSRDHGLTWDEGKILVLPERIYQNRRPYMKVASNNRDEIHFAFTDGHPNAEPTNSIYYAKYRNGVLYKADGEKIQDLSALPLDPKRSDVVYDATVSKERAWIWDIADSPEGNPVLVYAKFPTDSNHVYYYNIYDDGRWNEYKLVDSGGWFPHTSEAVKEREPNYSGGIVLDHGDPSTVYLSREVNGIFEIERWHTPDRGKNWSVTAITANSQRDNVRPFVVRDYEPGHPTILWMNIRSYRHYTDYQGAIKMVVLD